MKERYIIEFVGQNVRFRQQYKGTKGVLGSAGYVDDNLISINWETLHVGDIPTEGNARYRVTIEEIKED